MVDFICCQISATSGIEELQIVHKMWFHFSCFTKHVTIVRLAIVLKSWFYLISAVWVVGMSQA
jgi:hypothetical protein